MIRNRLKQKVRKLAIKAFGMEFDAEDRDPNAGGRANPNDFDPSVIPKIVDGAGDTPGPNHKQDIGRTWVAAQLAGGVAPFFIDIRTPMEMVAGVLPGAQRYPAQSIQNHLDILPAKDQRVTVYDQTGEQGSTEVAAWLRDQGWKNARRLQGGFAEWIEHGENTELPTTSIDSERTVGESLESGTVVDHNNAGTWIWTEDEQLMLID